MDLQAALQQLANDPAAPLDPAEVALRLAQDEYPHLDVEGYLSELDCMAHEVKAYLRGDLDVQVHGLCRYLFHEMGFHGNTQNYFDPKNSYLNDVLDRRTGLPITLSIVAMALGRRAGMDVQGVGLPGHFIAKAVSPGREIFFDPFHGGRRLTPEECSQLVEQVTGKPFRATPQALQAIPLGWIIVRMLNNLKGVYLKAEDYARLIRVTERLRQLAPEDATQVRDLGATFLQAGQPGKAIDHLEAYLTATPQGSDADAVRQLLTQAKSLLARWN
jgi:regulator of sirC expression with transglutaminase-like and TPR domain